MSEREITAGQVAGGVLALVVAAGAAWAGFAVLAKPARFDERIAAVTAQLDRAERLTRASRASSRDGARAVCPDLSEREVALVRQDLAAGAAQAGVTLTDLVAAPPSETAGYGRIAPVSLRLQGEGPYEAVLAWMDGLSQAQPEIFVDTLDLTSRSPKVSLKLTGKVFCWHSAT